MVPARERRELRELRAEKKKWDEAPVITLPLQAPSFVVGHGRGLSSSPSILPEAKDFLENVNVVQPSAEQAEMRARLEALESAVGRVASRMANLEGGVTVGPATSDLESRIEKIEDQLRLVTTKLFPTGEQVAGAKAQG
jgi:hypothetical protein